VGGGGGGGKIFFPKNRGGIGSWGASLQFFKNQFSMRRPPLYWKKEIAGEGPKSA